jgi:hypothetical protein
MKEILKQLITISIEDQKVNLSLKQMLMLDGGPMEMVQEVKNGMHLTKLVDSQKTKKSFMKEQDNHGSLVKTKKIKNHHITYSMLDQDLNLSLKQTLMLDGGPMEMVQVVKNGMHLKKLVDSQKTKKSFMKEQDNHGSQVKTKKIKNHNTIYSTLDREVNH